MKDVSTLIKDIYDLFDPDKGHTPNEENLDRFCQTLKDVLRVRLAERRPPDNPLRFSSLGRQDRQIYLDHHSKVKEKLTSKTYFKFLYGDVIEALFLFLAVEAGHTVERTQEEIEVDGVKGHIDAVIDGVVCDVKSASPFGYKKFVKGEVFSNDPFGYVAQLSGYASVLTPGKAAAWPVMDKVSADLSLVMLPSSIIEDNRPEPRIAHLKEVLEKTEPPPLCHEPVPDGKSGNMRLDTGCSYCGHKKTCFPDMRTFIYSTGPRYLTKVVNEPNVPEIEGLFDDE